MPKRIDFRFSYNYFLLGVNYLLPLTVLTLTYIRVGIELWGSQSIGEHRHDETVRTKRKVSIFDSVSFLKKKNRSKLSQVVKMMITVVSIFMISWFPYHAYFTMFMEKFAEMNLEYALHIYLNMYFLAMSSTIFNPIIYCWLNSRWAAAPTPRPPLLQKREKSYLQVSHRFQVRLPVASLHPHYKRAILRKRSASRSIQLQHSYDDPSSKRYESIR